MVEQVGAHVGQVLERRGLIELDIEIEACQRCGGRLRLIASIEEPQVIAKILSHLQRTVPERHPPELPQRARAPPQHGRLL